MDPPTRLPPSKRTVPGQGSNTASSQKFTSASSPSPFFSNPIAMQTSTEIARPGSRSQTVSIGWDEDNETTSRRTSRLQIELAECVETKTVTTTTTTKRSYPPLLIRQKSLEMLDSKEYPLAIKPTPAELTKISYDVEIPEESFLEGGPQRTLRKPRFEQSSYIRNLSQRKEVPVMSRRERSQESPSETLGAPGAKELNQQLALLKKMRSSKTNRGPSSSRSKSPRLSTAPRKSHLSEEQNMQRANLSQQEESSIRRHGLGMHISEHTSFPATPDMSELDSSLLERNRPINTSFQADAYTPNSGLSQNDSFEDITNRSELQNQEAFANAVATPPIAESDLEPLDSSSVAFPNIAATRPNVNTAIAQNASLPSPGLSPTFASAELHLDTEDDIDTASQTAQSCDSQDTLNEDDLLNLQHSGGVEMHAPSIIGMQSMLDTFDAMPNEMRSLMMFQLLRRCSRKTLHVLADVIGPALKCDFLEQLPIELSLHILGFLNHKDLSRAAQVSKHWRRVIDMNETGWKELFDSDGFHLPAGELERAIHQGWGWQDPYGPDGYEEDLSVQRAVSSDGDIASSSIVKFEEPARKVRSTTKRKRIGVGLSSERAKRRAVGSTDKMQSMTRNSQSAGFHKSEGPLSAASAAARAVPDPQLGLPGLRQLHLFKSLYRRHHMLQNSWMNPDVAPHHFAFAAHPAHVITCLQFDDDKILTGSDDTLIHVYDTKTGVLRKRLEGHEGGVWALQYEGNVLVSGSTDRSVRVWDIEKGLCTQVFHGHTSTVRCLQILMPEDTGRTEKGKPVMLPEKPLIITGSRDSQLRVWKLPEQGSKRYIQTGPPANDADCPYFVRVLAGHAHSVRAIAAHQDTLVSGSYDNTVRVWKISTGETLHRLTGHSMKVYSVVLDHKRNRCISGSMDNFVKIWSLDTGACLFTLEGHSSLVGLLDLRDERLVSAAADSTLRIWDPENGQCKSTLTAHTGAITCFQHDAQKVISGSDRTLKMWNIKTGECMKDLLTDLSGVWQVKFDERRCVAAVQRDNMTYLEVLDFGASRDGIPASQRGSRKVLSESSSNRSMMIEEIED
ncbi:WD repeat-containing protein-like protein pop1 [Halenospora varia]|nr:WD repeat-containing protein-like protein pop1 [Halenospora varia]